MPKRLPHPPHPPAERARGVIVAVSDYAADRGDPCAVVAGLFHIAAAVEAQRDQAVHDARRWGCTWDELRAATGLPIGTLQGRERIHLARLRGER